MKLSKKILLGASFGLTAFMVTLFLEAGGVSLFAPGFIGFGGLAILLTLGILETNFALYE